MATFTLTDGADTVTGGAAEDTVRATSVALNAGDSLTGGAGTDVLALVGSGTFDLSTLAQFTGFEGVYVTNITGGTYGSASNLTLRNGVDLTVTVDNQSGSETSFHAGTIQLADGTVSLDLKGKIAGYVVQGSTGTATINISDCWRGEFYLSSGTTTINSNCSGQQVFHLSSGAATIDVGGGGQATFNLSTGTADIRYHGSPFAVAAMEPRVNVSSGLATVDFSGSTGGANYVVIKDPSAFNFGNKFIGSTTNNIPSASDPRRPDSNNLEINGSGQEFDLTRLNIINKWNLTSSGNMTLEVNSSTLSHLLSIYGRDNEKLQTAAETLDLTNTRVSGGVTIASTNATGTTFTVADLRTGLNVIGGAGEDTLVAQGVTFTTGQRAALFLQGSIETITDTRGVYLSDGSSIFNGTLGADILDVDGKDVIHGLGGNDTIIGSGSFNVAFGDEGDDQPYFNGDQNLLFGSDGNDWLGVNGKSNALEGGSGDEVWIGASGESNTLNGQDGNDAVFANGGSNTLHGEIGNDWLGVSGNSNAMYGGGGTEWMGASGNGNYLIGGDGGDTLFSVGGNILYGETGDDWLGCSGNFNQMFGGDGADCIAASGQYNVLDGGAGNDILFAGANAHDHDTFAFLPGYGLDTAFNFVGEVGDKIDIRGWGIADYAALTHYLTDTADGLKIAFDGANQLTVQGVHALDPSWLIYA